MSFDILLFLLRIAFLALLYVFLFAVVRLAWAGLRRAGEGADLDGKAARVRLRVVSDGQDGLVGARFELWSSATLGRAEDNTIVLADPSVSAHHAAIRRERGCWMVQDLNSTNGTAVNGSWVADALPAYRGDVIRLGEVQLRLEVEEGPAASRDSGAKA